MCDFLPTILCKQSVNHPSTVKHLLLSLSILLTSSILLSLASCQKAALQTDGADSTQVKRDTLALYVAICPTEACLPLYYAEATGILDSLDANITLLSLGTMEDCDTALTHGVAEVAVSDLARLVCMSKDGVRATAMAQVPSSLTLYTAKGKRLNDVKQLKERLIAIERHSETDYWSDKLLEGTGLEQLDLFRTQFNSHKVRCDMLAGGLVEAAFLDWPYSVLAQAQGAKSIWVKKAEVPSWTVLAMLKQTLDKERVVRQAKQLCEAYDIAAKRLSMGLDSLRTDSILKAVYELPPLAVDTIPAFRQPQAGTLKKVTAQDVQAAKDWLVRRQWVSNSVPTEHIVSDK